MFELQAHTIAAYYEDIYLLLENNKVKSYFKRA